MLKVSSEKAVASHSSTLAWKIPWIEEPGRLQSMGSRRVRHDWATSLSLFAFMHWKEMATHSSVLAWRIPGTGEPGRLPSMGSHRVGHDWSDLAEAAESIFSSLSLALHVILVFYFCTKAFSFHEVIGWSFCYWFWFERLSLKFQILIATSNGIMVSFFHCINKFIYFTKWINLFCYPVIWEVGIEIYFQINQLSLSIIKSFLLWLGNFHHILNSYMCVSVLHWFMD